MTPAKGRLFLVPATLDFGCDAEAPLAPRVVVQANNALALHALALHGAGIAVLPRALVADDLAAGRLVAVLPGLSLGVEPLGLLLRNDETESPALAALVDWALERFGPQAVAPVAAPAAEALARGALAGAHHAALAQRRCTRGRGVQLPEQPLTARPRAGRFQAPCPAVFRSAGHFVM